MKSNSDIWFFIDMLHFFDDVINMLGLNQIQMDYADATLFNFWQKNKERKT